MKEKGKAAIAVLIVVVIAVGFHLGTIRWKHRKLIWQLQAAFVSGSIGFGAGFISGKIKSSK